MRIDLPDHLYRAYVANLFRARAIRLRTIASDRSKASIRSELEIEAVFCESKAQQLDDGDEGVTNDREPSRVNLTRDLEQLNPPKKEGEA